MRDTQKLQLTLASSRLRLFSEPLASLRDTERWVSAINVGTNDSDDLLQYKLMGSDQALTDAGTNIASSEAVYTIGNESSPNAT